MENLLLKIFNDKYQNFIVDTMPDSSVRDFYKWVMNDNNHIKGRYFQKSGILKMVELYNYIFVFIDKNDNKIVDLYEKISDLIIYQVYEVISDNICINKDNIEIRDNIKIINDIIIESLNSGIDKISLMNIEKFDFISNHLSEDNSDILNMYRKINKEIDIENESWIIIYMNIISCLNIIKNINLNSYRKSIGRRYTSLNHISINKYDDIEEVLRLQSETIMVNQTIQYCIYIYTEIYNDEAVINEIFNNSHILSIIYDAAIIIRLLNDLGLYFLEYSSQEIEICFKNLLDNKIMKGESWIEWFLRIALELPFNRLYKDILFNEYNTALFNICIEMNQFDMIDKIIDNIKYLSLIYKRCIKNIEDKKFYLFDNGYKYIYDIVINMIKFHQDVYSKEYTLKEGEFAI